MKQTTEEHKHSANAMKTESTKPRFLFSSSYCNEDRKRSPMDCRDGDASAFTHSVYCSLPQAPVVFFIQWNAHVAKEVDHVVIAITVFI
jgi:hypothetical protein